MIIDNSNCTVYQELSPELKSPETEHMSLDNNRQRMVSSPLFADSSCHAYQKLIPELNALETGL